MYAVVTGGGTSGHVMPALAIIELLQEAGYNANDLAYVGARRGIETRIMKDSDVVTEFLPISGLQRSLSLRNIALNIMLPFRLFRSRLIARQLLRKWNPRVVVSVGGYASEPISAAAIAAGIPLVCVSYDRIPGLATRKQARHATACAVAFPETVLPHSTVTGAPVRSALRHVDVASQQQAARVALGLPVNATVLTIMGGSLGSGVLNSVVPSLLESCATVGNVAVFHICGERFINEESAPSVPSGIVEYIRTGYDSRMADIYAATDVLVARAGASTIAEVATIGLASVIVPWSGAADNHQQLNAEWLAADNAAILVPESGCASGEVVAAVRALLENPQKRRELAMKSRDKGALHRGTALVGVITNAAR